MTINQEMLDVLKVLHGRGGLGPATHEQLGILIRKAEVGQQELSIQEISARERLIEVTRSLRAFEQTPLSPDQTKRLKAMIQYNDLALSGVKPGLPRWYFFAFGLAAGTVSIFFMNLFFNLLN